MNNIRKAALSLLLTLSYVLIAEGSSGYGGQYYGNQPQGYGNMHNAQQSQYDYSQYEQKYDGYGSMVNTNTTDDSSASATATNPDEASDDSSLPPLPEGWVEYIDPNSGRPYYYNAAEGVTTWERPLPVESEKTPEPPVEEEPIVSPEKPSLQESEIDKYEKIEEKSDSNSESYGNPPVDVGDYANVPGGTDTPPKENYGGDEKDVNDSTEGRPVDAWSQYPDASGMGNQEQTISDFKQPPQQQSSIWGRPMTKDQEQPAWGQTAPIIESQPPQPDEQKQEPTPAKVTEPAQKKNQLEEEFPSITPEDKSQTPPNVGPGEFQGKPFQRPPPQQYPQQQGPGYPYPSREQSQQQQQQQQQQQGPDHSFQPRGQQPPYQQQQSQQYQQYQQQQRGPNPQYPTRGMPQPQQVPPQQSQQGPPQQLQQGPPQQSQQGPPQQSQQAPQNQYPPRGQYPPSLQQQQRDGQYGRGWTYGQGPPPYSGPPGMGRGQVGQVPPYGSPDQKDQQGQLVVKTTETTGAVKEALGSAWQGVLGFGNRTKSVVGQAKESVIQGASQVGQTVGSTSVGIWGRAKESVGNIGKSIFEKEDEGGNPPYSLSSYGAPPPPSQRQPQTQYPPQNYGGYPPGYGLPGPRGSPPYPHQGMSPSQPGEKYPNNSGPPGPPGLQRPPMQSQWEGQQGMQQQGQQYQNTPPGGQYGQQGGYYPPPQYRQMPPKGQPPRPQPSTDQEKSGGNPSQHPGWNGY
eukprot:CAMPEP_0184855418 /NCGR_PEP_ID=MMETSP0580-20130426/683_1 /TAXON_ID=1118495 /ORGANISM="Dactyliosolen fragilissimus" /LENGTH=737 /DNA_ID=CAMNT_0027349929 /DNA_START=173 /DNA_END=2389 /DNA_ORIENTATION=-